MVRLRSSFVFVWVFVLFAIAALAAPPPASAQGPGWIVINAPSTGPGVTTQGTAPPPVSEPDHLYIIEGDAAVGASPLPQTIKNDLVPPQEPGTVTANAEDDDFFYIVAKEIAEGIDASEIAGELTPEIEAIAEPLDEEVSSASYASGETAASLFGGSCASKEQIVKRSVDLNGKTWSKNFELGEGFTGSYSLTGQLTGQATAEIKLEIKRKKVIAWCVPYSAKFKSARAFGNATSNAGVTLTGTLKYVDTFGPYEDIIKPELFSVVFWVGPIPVRVGFNLPISAGLDINAVIAGSLNYNGTHVATGTFDYTCTKSNCTGSANFENTPVNGSTQTLTGGVDGRVKPTPWVDIGFRAYLYTESIAYAQIGVRPHLLGDLWGYTGNSCGDGDGNGNNETVRSLTFDLDRRIDLTAQARVLDSDPWKRTLKTGSVVHMGFWDLLGSSALQPQFHGPSSVFVGDAGAYKVKIRPCWPYTDKVTYQLNWGDGGAVQALEGAPGTELSASHTWSAAGSKAASATVVKDAHGRTINQSTPRTIDVKAITPPSVTVTPAPASATYGLPINLTATVTGGHTPTLQYTLGRRLVGTTAWIPSPLVWQADNVLSWTPTSADVGNWELAVGVKDRTTAPDANGLGYAAAAVAGTVQVVAPLTLSCPPAVQRTVTYGNTFTWNLSTTGGTPGTIQYASARQLTGNANNPWLPNPLVWQTGSALSWTPTASDLGTWQFFAVTKDVNTPANPGYSATCNLGQIVVVSPLTVTITSSPATSIHGNQITWTATATGGTVASTRFAFFRRKAGATAWTPDVTLASWQTENWYNWTPGAADVGTWEIVVWVKDGNTPSNANIHGYSSYANAGPVKVVTPPLTLSVTVSPSQVVYGNPVTMTATATGGTPSTTRFAFFRRKAGTVAWTPDASTPSWQVGNTHTWTPALADVGTWETYVWVKDGDTPSTMNNNYGYAVGRSGGNVNVLTTPLTLTSTASPGTSYHSIAINWTATAGGGTPSTTQYALFRRPAGTTTWIPAVTAPAWQTSPNLSWTPALANVGSWEISIWVKDGDTPSTQNTYGYATSYNPGTVQIVAPPTLSVTMSPASVSYGTTITWTASSSSSNPSSVRYAFFRRRSGTTAWTPSANTPNWQISNTFSWATTSADAGTWDTYVWVKDAYTPASMNNNYGYAAGFNTGGVRVVAPLSGLSCSVNSSAGSTGTTFTWTANASGGDSATLQYALFRRRAGTTSWTPSTTAPAWQSGNVMSWTTTSSDAGTYEISIWAKDGVSSGNVTCNPGSIQVFAPLTVTGTTSPSTSPYGAAINWTATASGGDASTIRYAIFRRRAGTSAWTPDVTTPSWQTSRSFSWTPTSADVGTWEVFIWVKDAYTPPNMNIYGHAAWYNAGAVEVTTPAPVTLSGTGSPSMSPAGTTITWTATASGGIPGTYQYALFRRRAGTTPWTPDVTAPNWQSSRTLSWTPSSADVGTWEIFVWVKDVNTPPTMNNYGQAAWYNAGAVQVY